MDELQSLEDACHEELCLLLCECSHPGDMEPQVSARVQVHHQVKIVLVLEGVLHVDYKWVLEGRQYFSLIDHRMDTALRKHSGLIHLFHGKILIV